MKLLVGLGNPGGQYARNRHNVGFMAVERIASAHRFGPWKKKFHGQAADGVIDGKKVLLLKPDTFMNESGRSVGEAVRFAKLDLGDVIVFHDELDLAPGKIRVKTGGGSAGHNGLRSISAHLGHDFVRVRMGIGHPGAKELVHHWVLHDFARDDAAWLDPLLDAVAGAAGRLVAGGEARFMTDVARALSDNDAGRTQDRLPKTPKLPPARHEGQREPVIEPSHQPSGERQSKRASALAENLKRWLAGRKKE